MRVQGCAPAPEPRHCGHDHVDPEAATVRDATGYTILSVGDDGNLIRRPAMQVDMRHCASCTCPIKKD